MQVSEAVIAAIDADIPTMLVGSPGTGKTAFVTHLAAQRRVLLTTLIGSTMDPTDLGYMLVKNGSVVVDPPAWAKQIHKVLETRGAAWLFLDEFTSMPPSVMAAFLRVVNERFVGQLNLRGCRIIGAMNPVEQAANGNDLDAASKNRWCFVPWDVNVAEWIEGSLRNWGIEDREGQIDARTFIASYIRLNPSKLVGKPMDTENGYPSPRAWTNLSCALTCLNATPRNAVLSSVGGVLAGGLIGKAAAAELITYADAMDLPNVEKLLYGFANMPPRGDQQMACCDALVVAALQKHEQKQDRINRVVQILTSIRADVAVASAGFLLKSLSRVETEALPPDIIKLGEKLKKL